MKKIFVILCIILPVVLHGQNDRGIIFTETSSWPEVLKKAKIEHKAIFIDAMATWCGPCKQMDKEVYTNSEIGKYVNEHFISVKIQMDSTKYDNNRIQSWRADTKKIASNYNVVAMPSFLFFNENGEFLYKDQAYKSIEEFSVLIRNSLNPTSNYVGLIDQYKLGKINESQLLQLISLHKELKKDSLALEVASKYKMQVIDGQQAQKIMTPMISDFIAQFSQLFSFKDSVITYMYHYPDEADKLLKVRPGFSKEYSEYIISRDYIYKLVWHNNVAVTLAPDWYRIERNIAQAYRKPLAKKLVLIAKLRWSREKNDWAQVVKQEIELTDLNGIDTSWLGRYAINNMVFRIILKHSNETQELKKGIGYMEIILKVDPDHHQAIDTYANVLYKAGFKSKAIEQEKIAMAKAIIKNDTEAMNEYQTIIDKMMNNIPTW